MRRLAITIAVAIGCHSVPDAPTTIDFDHEPCAHCRMLIGDPRYAAQLVTDAGDVLDFDDPGCLLRYVADVHPAVHRMFFHDARGAGWLVGPDVAFVVATTPMGYGYAAVAPATPGAVPLATVTTTLETAHRRGSP